MQGSFGSNGNLDFLLDHGEMGPRIRAFDWAATPLGHPDGWPHSLRTLVGVVVSSSQPMFVAWGPQRTLLYNDAYAEILAGKHPAALGRPLLDVWSEVRDKLLPIVEKASAGKPVRREDVAFTLDRRGYPEEAHFSFSWTPVSDEKEAIAGLFCVCTETTGQIMFERQLASEKERQQRLFEQAPGFIAILSGPDHVFEFVNEAYRRLVGHRDCIGRTAREVLPELAEQGFFEHLERVYATGERFVAYDVPVHLQRSSGAMPEERFLAFIYEPVIDAAGRVSGIFCEGYDVTDAHLAQAALQKSEERLRRVLETDAVGVLFFNREGTLVASNEVFLKMTGWSREDIAGGRLDWRRMTPPEWIAASEAQMDTLRQTGRLGPYEKEYLRKDGSRAWMLFAGRDLGDGTIVEFALDITRRKQAEIALARREAELASSERRFRVLTDAMPQIVWSTRPDGHHDYFNRRWYEFTGVPEGSTYGDAWSELFHPDDMDHTWARWHRSLTSGEPYETEYRLRHRSGEYRWVLGRALPVRNEQGEIERWIGTCTDIHELKRTQQALAESQEFTSRLLSSSDDCIAVLDLDGRLRFMNEGGQRVMEVGDFRQIEGSHWPSLCSTAEEVRAALETAKAGETGRFQGLCPTIAGTPKWWDVVVTPVKGPDGRPERLLWISRDITERKRLEEQQALVNRELHHRVKNTLATVQAVISSTARRARSIAEFQQAVTERISSLAKTHTLLIEKDQCGATLRDVLSSELAPYDDGTGQRVRLAGPDVRLPSEFAVALGMAVHELTTNAAKYGALSLPTGHVDVIWSLENREISGDQLFLEWQEQGGPPVKAPERQGFGSVLLQRALGRQLGGDVEATFAPSGLQVRINATLPSPEPKLLGEDRTAATGLA